MPAFTLPSSKTDTLPTHSSAASGRCPFHDGLATLDGLLAEIGLHEAELFDAVLDLRSLAIGGDATACLEQLFKVRALLAGRHYLAFYRVRCWARRAFRIEVRTHRGAVAAIREFPLNGGRLDEVVNSSLAAVATQGELPASAHVRFVFAAATA